MKRARRFPGMEEYKPAPPDIADEKVAARIADAIFDEVNVEETYWFDEERADVVDKIASMIMKRKSVGSLFWHLHRAEPPIDDRHNRSVYPWGYGGLQNFPESRIADIARTVLDAALTEYKEKYM